MKHYLAFLTWLLMWPACAVAQNYFVEGTVWEYDMVSSETPDYEPVPCVCTLAEPCVVEGRECLKLFGVRDDKSLVFMSYISVDGDKVYFLKDLASAQWVLMYDFGVEVGETITVDMYRDLAETYVGWDGVLTCLEKSAASYGGNGGMVFDCDSYCKVKWIKGIGSVSGPTLNLAEMIDGYGGRLRRVTSGGRVVFEDTSGISDAVDDSVIVVRAVDGGVSVSGASAGVPVTIYGMDGGVVRAGNTVHKTVVR